jgi:hypothetical protein
MTRAMGLGLVLPAGDGFLCGIVPSIRPGPVLLGIVPRVLRSRGAHPRGPHAGGPGHSASWCCPGGPGQHVHRDAHGAGNHRGPTKQLVSEHLCGAVDHHDAGPEEAGGAGPVAIGALQPRS